MNLGGAGASHEPKNAINVNNMAVGRKNIPNLVEADGGAVGELFEAGTIYRARGLPHGAGRGRLEPGGARCVPGFLSPAGPCATTTAAPTPDAKVAEAELKAAGFQDVKALGDAFVTARKP